jgi:hypothetical protein
MEKQYVQCGMKFGRSGPKREELRGDWRKLRNKEAHDLYCLSNVLITVKEDGVGSECGTCGREEKCVQGKCEDKIPLGRPRW